MEQCFYHIPVLLEPAVAGLNIQPDGIYVDATFGGGGHSGEIIKHLSNNGHLYAFDQDADALQNATRNDAGALPLTADGRFTFVASNFRYLKNWMRYYGAEGVHGVLADLGVSSHHFDDEQRGFSFRFDAPLDMRMNQHALRSAAQVVNEASADELTTIFRIYGELKNAPRLAQTIVRERAKGSIQTTHQLASLLLPLCGHDREKKNLAKAFQALRIEVNHEMEALKEMLAAATELLVPGGRLVVISYHSLEDRMVKNLIRAGNMEGEVTQDIFGNTDTPLRAIGKPIMPDADELQANPRSRSARMRIAEKCG